MPDRAEEIMTALVGVAETLGMPVEVDRAYPVLADPRSDGTPADMPLVVVRTGEEDMDSPEAKAWRRRWVMTPSMVVFLKNTENPNALRGQAQELFLQVLDAVEASAIPKLITRNTSPLMRKDLKPVVGRPDVLMLIVSFELRFER
jgi:hypothetical protein